jgi:DNA invertase Pin-like site-specific DNA recombinase
MSKSKAAGYSYIRFSSRQQAEGDSLRRQTEAAEAWCKKNGVRLDTSLSFRDLGKSAYLGAHRHNPDRHALASFLKLVESGRVHRGSYLVIESLDRLTREHVRAGLMLLLGLIESGVRIVQLSPSELVYDESSDEMALMLAIVELSRGHRESKRKSDTVGAAWRRKKRAAAEDRKPITRQCPAWLRVEGDAFAVDEGKAAAVREVFRLAAAGYGTLQVAKKLTADGVPAIGRTGRWNKSYVGLILRSREAVGEYRPTRVGKDRRREADGEVIPGFYPAVVSEHEWQQTRGAICKRLNGSGRPRGGRPSAVRTNLWAGLLTDARDGKPLYVVHKGDRSAGLVLTRPGDVAGANATFPAQPFEEAVLSKLREVTPADILPDAGGPAERLSALAAAVAEVEGKLAGITASLVKGGLTTALDKAARELDAELTRLRAEQAEARAEAATPVAESLGEVSPLVEALNAAKDPHEVRLRLRGVLRAVLVRVPCLTVRRGLWRLLACQLHFVGGAVRSYLVLHHPRHRCGRREWAERTLVRSFVESGVTGSLNMTNAKHVQKLEAFLAAVDLPAG